jgi:hypothetical protein
MDHLPDILRQFIDLEMMGVGGNPPRRDYAPAPQLKNKIYDLPRYSINLVPEKV